MLLRDMSKMTLKIGQFRRGDGEKFELTAVLYQTPMEYDYWLCVFDAEHTEWGHLRFQAVIPKRIAQTPAFASSLAQGPIVEQVKSSLTTASPSGRDLNVAFSVDGWSLI